MAIFSKDKFTCARCGQKNEPIGFAPLPTDLGQKIGAECCKNCWSEWLEKQKQIINHFGLDLSNPDSHDYLFDQMKLFFYDDGTNLAAIDETKEGTIEW
ncbi:MAG: Fe(2+)-trafficking protein [Pyrinomonadaceae bacterium]|nr:Fe(2+)-trafficking protein [Pyrinomonadaceae bacterium]